MPNGKKPQHNIGKPREPFPIPQDWEQLPHYRFVTKCDRVQAFITPTTEGDYDLTLRCGRWSGIDDAKQVAKICMIPLVDEHGFARDFDECEWDEFEALAGAPTVVEIDTTLPIVEPEEKKQEANENEQSKSKPKKASTKRKTKKKK